MPSVTEKYGFIKQDLVIPASKYHEAFNSISYSAHNCKRVKVQVMGRATNSVSISGVDKDGNHVEFTIFADDGESITIE